MPDTFPDGSGNRVEPTHGRHGVQPPLGTLDECFPLTMYAYPLEESHLIIDTAHIQSPLRMAIDVINPTQSRSDTVAESSKRLGCTGS